MNEMKRYILMILAIAGVFGCAFSADTADEVLNHAAQAVKSADGISASFTLNSGGQTLTGTLKSSGDKFSLQTSTTSVWYDGKTMWTYNPKTKETTVTLPTPTEVAEVNPLYIVNIYSNNFTVTFAKSQTKGCRTIVLTPKSRKLGYKSVHLTIPDKSSFPSRVVVIPTSGHKITVNIEKANTGVRHTASTFIYPKSKYPKAEIVDLR